jgi:hypothetical protein
MIDVRSAALQFANHEARRAMIAAVVAMPNTME